ncbi:MAG: DegV family protein [Lachnospiraceae bacterium]|nr:DegV family protein [Lachnospiraceae bacterium]
MKKIAIVTDSNSGITQKEGKENGIFVLPMPFYINDELFFEELTLSQEEFYAHLKEDAEIHTSQPAPGDLLDLWDGILKDYDEILHIPMSSGLSSSCETAVSLALDYDGRVQVVNNQRISITQKQSVYDAKELAEHGRSAAEIKKILEDCRFESSIYITVDTLKYLKRGGRVTPAAAAIGAVLNIKPVLQINGEKLDAFAKVRGMKAARKTMIDAMKKDFETKYKDCNPLTDIHLALAYTCGEEDLAEWRCEVEAAFPGMPLIVDPLSLSVSCHIGPGSIAIGCSKKITVN